MSKNISGGGILQVAFWCGLFIFLTFMGMSLWTSFIDSQVSKIALIEYKNLPYHCSGSGRSFYCTPRNVDLLQNATSLEKFWLGMRESYYLAGMLLSISGFLVLLGISIKFDKEENIELSSRLEESLYEGKKFRFDGDEKPFEYTQNNIL